MKKSAKLIAGILFVHAFAMTALADTMTFTWTSMVSAGGGAQGFVSTNADGSGQTLFFGSPDAASPTGYDSSDFTIVATGDLANKSTTCNDPSNGGQPCVYVPLDTATITITDVYNPTTNTVSTQTFTFDTATRAFMNNETGVPGFARSGINGADLFIGPYEDCPTATHGPCFGPWEMDTSVSSVSGSASIFDWSDILTNAGYLYLDPSAVQGTTTTFRADLTPSGPTPVPEPSSFVLLGLGLAGMFTLGRKKKLLRAK